MSTGNIYRKFGDIWTCGFRDMRVDRWTDRQTDMLMAVLHAPTGDEVINREMALEIGETEQCSFLQESGYGRRKVVPS